MFVCRCDLLLQVARSVICVLGTLVNCAKTAALIEILFEGLLVWTQGTIGYIRRNALAPPGEID